MVHHPQEVDYYIDKFTFKLLSKVTILGSMAVQQIIKSAYYLIDTQLRTGEKQTLVRVFTNIIHWEDTRKYCIND